MTSHAAPTVRIVTDKPVAYDSPDHIVPYGTALNNTSNPNFNHKLFAAIPSDKIRLLDLGCAGGGFVKSVLNAGGFGIGLEGSDYSRKHQRAEWPAIPNNLFTADMTEPFELFQTKDGHESPLYFNVITAWDVMEHIASPQIPAVMANIDRHLAPEGIVIFSIANFSSVANGVELHQTMQPYGWWVNEFNALGFKNHEDATTYFGDDMLRQSSFYVVLTRFNDDLPFGLDEARLRYSRNPVAQLDKGLLNLEKSLICLVRRCLGPQTTRTLGSIVRTPRAKVGIKVGSAACLLTAVIVLTKKNRTHKDR